MNTLASKSVSRRSLATALQTMGARVWARTKLALRRFAARHAAACMYQARLEIRRFQACHPWPSDGDNDPRSTLRR